MDWGPLGLIGILANPGPGFGPLVRCLDMARRLRRELGKALEEQICIIFPWIYGEDQRRILAEEIRHEHDLLADVLLSTDLGGCLKPLLFDGQEFNDSLARWIAEYDTRADRVAQLLDSRLEGVDLEGNIVPIDGRAIRLEVSRNPAVSTPIDHSYYTSVGYAFLIFSQVLKERNTPWINYGLLEQALPMIHEMEAGFCMHFQPMINSLSFSGEVEQPFDGEVRTPPLIPFPRPVEGDLESGIYISFSGINTRFESYDELNQIERKRYSNCVGTGYPEGETLSPSMIAHPSITHVIARAAWNTIWLANLTGTTLICPEYHPGDHPEILYNTKTIESHGLGHIWRTDDSPLESLLEQASSENDIKVKRLYETMMDEFGTLDGIEYCAHRIIEDFLHE